MNRIEARPARGITREVLEDDAVRAAISETHPEVPLLADETLRASMERTLQQRPARVDADGVWLFAYGSLLWNPCIEVAQRCPARLYGYHRDFRLKLTYGRGTPETPGLMLGLVPGGSCRGMALRVPAEILRQELMLVWRREMLTGVYVPRWLTLKTPGGDLPAIAFTVDRTHDCYCGRLGEDDTVALMATGQGLLGTAQDYLESTVGHLDSEGIYDRRLHHLRACVRRYRAGGG
ncbi:gamma-glutamylcyclotransferase [Halofilum ochraceum]|uniref:gamma-glutamylcyclotransferase n=1 Tax=Halofilum ochraceum TaxID=1611323 RepID=UPI0008DA18D3|nr:gamma-glutamylcyclotransferase [Halofilum ochraceum]